MPRKKRRDGEGESEDKKQQEKITDEHEEKKGKRKGGKERKIVYEGKDKEKGEHYRQELRKRRERKKS